MLKKFIKILTLFSLATTLLIGEEMSLEKLEQLKNVLSKEDYEFLKSELNGNLMETQYFSLFINRTLVSNTFPVTFKNNYTYISLDDYFKEIHFKNYNFRDGVLEMFLGKRVRRVLINFNTLKIKGIEKTNFQERDFYVENGQYFLRLEFFRDIFLNAVDINYPKTTISMSSRYTLPNEIRRLLSQTESGINLNNKKYKMFYTNKRELFNLGYLRVNFDKIFSKSQGESTRDWSGNLGYQGSLLYGTFKTEFDVKKEKINSSSLRYDNLPFNHFLEFKSVEYENDWEKSILFEKDKGYYDTGKNFIIREDVPIGSRVELIYLGATIAIAYEKNGVVTFDNSEIKSDREYLLKIHTRDGLIETKIIKTSDDFNQQNKGEYQYRFFGKDNHYETEIFYGLTENLTLGGSYSKKEAIEKFGGEFVYSNYISLYPYTLILASEKINSKKEYNKDTSFNGTFQIKYKKLKLKYEDEHFSDYYFDKNSRKIFLEYNPFNFLRVNYSYNWLENWDNEKNNGDKINIELTKNFKRFLTTFEFEKDIENEKIYSLNLYYTGYRDYSIRWNNSILDSSGHIESSLELFNRGRENGFDYSFEISYNQIEKEKFTFAISFDYNNWFNFNFTGKDSKNMDISGGIDRVIDLKNIKKPLESMDSSRVKVNTFLDINDNNKYDKNEPFIGNVEVTINNERKITSSTKPTYFFGVPNDILYNFKPKVRIPSYDVVNTNFSLKGKGGGDIYVDIPIKPLFSISGRLILDNLTSLEKLTIYDGVVVKIKDSKGVILESMLLDHLGYYDISGLTCGKYQLEITSFKNLKIKPLKLDLNLKFNEKIGNNVTINSTIVKNKITLIK